jgi:hypothetical protein
MSTFLSDIIEDVFEGALTELGFTSGSTYTSVTSTYDPATSETTNAATATATVTPVYYSAKDSLARLASLIRQEEDETVEGVAPQLKAVLPVLQLEVESITPKVNDTLTRGTTLYNIEAVAVDPAQAAYVFTLRETTA